MTTHNYDPQAQWEVKDKSSEHKSAIRIWISFLLNLLYNKWKTEEKPKIGT